MRHSNRIGREDGRGTRVNCWLTFVPKVEFGSIEGKKG